MQWQLMLWGDGEVHMTFWDHLHGDDLDFSLRPGGVVVDNKTGAEVLAEHWVQRLVALARQENEAHA